jgi:antitoxin component YwqK of YwqJK toxin-antitoxin module
MSFRFFPGLLLLTCYNFLLAQPRSFQREPLIEKITLYYDGAAELTSSDKASVKRIVEMNLDAMVFHGVYQDFDLNDNLITEGYFHEGHKQGLRNEYFKDRSLKSTIDFSGDDFVIWQLKSELKQDLVVNGTGKFTLPFFYGTGTTLQPRWKQGKVKGEFQFGKRIGKWHYVDLGNTKLDEEEYDKGKFTRRWHYENGDSVELNYPKTIYFSLSSLMEGVFKFNSQNYFNLTKCFSERVSYPPTFNRAATFAGGLKRLLLLIAQRVPVPENSQMVIRISINENGIVTSTSVEQGLSKLLDAAAVAVIKSVELKFFPAIRKGKPYSSELYLPIYGGAEGIKLIEALPYDFIQPDN